MAYGITVIQVVLKTLPSCLTWQTPPPYLAPFSAPAPALFQTPSSLPLPFPSPPCAPFGMPRPTGSSPILFFSHFLCNTPFLLLVFLCRCNKTMATKNAKMQKKNELRTRGNTATTTRGTTTATTTAMKRTNKCNKLQNYCECIF